MRVAAKWFAAAAEARRSAARRRGGGMVRGGAGSHHEVTSRDTGPGTLATVSGVIHGTAATEHGASHSAGDGDGDGVITVTLGNNCFNCSFCGDD